MPYAGLPEDAITDYAGLPADTGYKAGSQQGYVDGVPKWGRENPNLYAGTMTALDLAPAIASFAKSTGVGIPLAGAINVGAKAIQRGISGEPQSVGASLSDFAKGATVEGVGRGLGWGITKLAKTPVVRDAIGKVAEKLTEMTIKPPTTMSNIARRQSINTALEGGFLPNAKGISKLNDAIDQAEKKISEGISRGKNADVKGSFDKAISNLESLRSEANVSSDPVKNNQLIDEEIARLMNHPMADANKLVPISEMQRMKVRQGREIKKTYGEQRPQFMNDIDKARIRGLKEELEDKLRTYFPELAPTNKQLGKYYELEPVLERASNRIENRLGIGIDLPIKSGAGAGLGSLFGPEGAAVGAGIGTVAGVLEHPAVAPRVGRALYKGSRMIPEQTPKLAEFAKRLSSAPIRGVFDAAVLTSDPLGLRGGQ